MPFGERYIWGVTAGILRNLYETSIRRMRRQPDDRFADIPERRAAASPESIRTTGVMNSGQPRFVGFRNDVSERKSHRSTDMIRPVLTEIALFLTPFVVYAIFLWATRAGVLDPQAWTLRASPGSSSPRSC